MSVFLIFDVYPVFFTFFISLHKWAVIGTRRFIGIDNYITMLKDPVFWISLRQTTYFVIGYVTLTTVIGLGLAVFTNTLIGFAKGVVRTTSFIPVVCSMSAVAVMFTWLFNPSMGPLNYYLGLVGIGPYMWIRSSTQVMPSIILMSVWKAVGYTMVLYMAGLTTIPNVFYEAAEVDGASRWQKFVHITFPLLRPTTLFVLVTSVIGSYQVFTQAFALTGGGPGTSSMVLVLYLYNIGFRYFRMGQASALAYLLFAIVLVITLFQIRYLRSRFEY